MSDTTPDLDTHLPGQFHIGECNRRATLTWPWLLEKEHKAGTHPQVANNEVKVLMCGKDAFERIATDIDAAQSSIDLICWGFDPGMELVRTGDAWPRGQPYGSLLHAAANRGVKVRLLVWYEAGFAAMKQNNMPGFTGDQRAGYAVTRPTTTREDMARAGVIMPPPTLGGSDGRTPEQLRHDYCVGWWRDVQADTKNKSGKGGGIEWRTRKGNKAAVQKNLAGKAGVPHSAEADMPSSEAGSHLGFAHERTLIEDHATHHQKTILIDYAYEGGKKAVGYVMGLNSTTDYWDTLDHEFDTPKREVDWGRKSKTAQALPEGHSISRDPFQDYACRIVGPALRGVHKNFVAAWTRAGGKARADDADVLPPQLAKVSSPYRAQIVRTQPEEGDKTIKYTYFHASQFARDYIYIENQYFFYEEWVRVLKEKRENFMTGMQAGGRSKDESTLLHLFAVIPSPEDDGMVPRTYDMVKSLGEGTSMPAQHAAMQDKKKAVEDTMAYDRQRYETQMSLLKAGIDPTKAMKALPKPKNYTDTSEYDAIYQSAMDVQAPTKNHKTGELQGLGLKVLIGRLITCNRGKPLPKGVSPYRQIYIHSKLMVIDDAFFTLGSANLNVRSMAADSEINVASDDHDEAGRVRKMVWHQHARGFGQTDGGCGGRMAIAAAFKAWKKLMDNNKQAVRDGNAITGFLVQFQDDRQINHRHG